MPVKHLETYLQERKHLQTLPLNALSDSRLGIDAAYYLQSLYENPPTNEPLLAATGGLPLSLATRIESDLRTLEKLRIKPVFVFPASLQISAPDTCSATSSSRRRVATATMRGANTNRARRTPPRSCSKGGVVWPIGTFGARSCEFSAIETSSFLLRPHIPPTASEGVRSRHLRTHRYPSISWCGQTHNFN
ncbi:hypothetical protein BC826DRAFT_65946 [Russula brevipes]|nr:hypothetical protein BC826DRAFT_65946 [Russula brevipes]